LTEAKKTWGDTIDRLVTHRFLYTQYDEALSLHSTDEIKSILEWAR
jgi:hypothetical protein